MPSCLVVQHVAPERSFAIGAALDAAGVKVDLRRIYRSDPLPRRLSEEVEGLVVMGGPMSAQSDEGFPSRQQEIELLAEALALGVPTLGVCLGAQLLAVAAGGQVLPGRAGPEIGWADVQLSRAASTDPLFATLPTPLKVLHWHGDTYELPPGAVHLASSTRYQQQAFRIGQRAWGLQFHLEVDEAAVAQFAEAFGQDALAAGVKPATILSAAPGALRELAPRSGELFGSFARLVAGNATAQSAVATDELADLV